MNNLPDTIYQEFIEEVENLHLKANMSATAVVGELTRALKRVTNKHGGTEAMTDTNTEVDNLYDLFPDPYPQQNMGLLPDESTHEDDLRVEANRAAERNRTSVNQLLLKAQRSELQDVLKNSSGGGSWRRVIISRITALDNQIKEGE